MKQIKSVLNILPITYDNRKIIILNNRYLEDYTSILTSESYNEFLDFNFNKDISIDKLCTIMYNLVVGYVLKLETEGHARLLCIDTTNDNIVGGCSLFDANNDCIEISYFLTEEYKHKNEAYKMIYNILNTIKNSDLTFNKLSVTIQERNIASIKLATKLGFVTNRYIKGKYCRNILMELEREKIGNENM